jgi:lipoprotein Spr
MKFIWGAYFVGITAFSCHSPDYSSPKSISPHAEQAGASHNTSPVTGIVTGKTTPAELIAFARTLSGTPYKYGSTDPAYGFDCSGFITYVFNHFGISVPRSSVDFTFVQREIAVTRARPGDLILFTGTDSTIRTVGHMGIIVSNNGSEIVFIHSTSGKAYGVTETPLNAYYEGRFMKTIRIFPQNDR